MASVNHPTTRISLTGDYRIDSLIYDEKWGAGVGTGAVLTYSFHTPGVSTYPSANSYTSDAPYNGGWCRLVGRKLAGGVIS